MRIGPTTRSHCNSQKTLEADYLPSSDEDINTIQVKDSDDDVVFFVPLSTRKSRSKKRKVRQWYQICWKMCFLDVYPFRRALVNLQVTQRKNFHYHINNKDRIIVDFLEEGCHLLNGCI